MLLIGGFSGRAVPVAEIGSPKIARQARQLSYPWFLCDLLKGVAVFHGMPLSARLRFERCGLGFELFD
jgi:hypothetical protein